MDRKSFATRLALLGVCPLMIQNLTAAPLIREPAKKDEDCDTVKSKKEFVEHWLSDLLDSMEQNVDRETQEKIVGNCGIACFNRYPFKQDIALSGKGDLDKLIEAYKKNFEIWKDGNTVHIRYGEVSSQCYCPAANYRPPKPNDLHCECTKNTHKTIFETALGRPFQVDIAESLRRGGKTCHFVVHLS